MPLCQLQYDLGHLLFPLQKKPFATGQLCHLIYAIFALLSHGLHFMKPLCLSYLRLRFGVVSSTVCEDLKN